MTVTLEARANHIVNQLNTAVQHLEKNKPNRMRKIVSEFLLSTRRFQRETNWSWDKIYTINKCKAHELNYIQVLSVYLKTNGKHARRNELAQIIKAYFEANLELKKPLNTNREKAVITPRKISKGGRVSLKNLMNQWSDQKPA